MPWYLFAAAAPLCYSIAVFIDKFLIDKRIKDPFALTSLFGIVSGCVGLLIGFITGFKSIGFPDTALIMFGGMLLLVYLIPYFEAMKIDDASRVIPLFQFIPVITLILSAVFLKETLTNRQILGLFVVVGGAILISMERLEGSVFRPRKSFYFMILSSLTYGTVGILFRFTVKNAGYWSTLSYEYMGTGIAGLLLFSLPNVRKSLKNDMESIKNSLSPLAADKGLGILAQMSEGAAISLAAVPLVNVVESIQPILMLIEGIFLTLFFPHIIKENIRREVVTHKLVSIFFILLGLYLVYSR
ncbi:EamA family transporter [Patescibacteria group bacterium]|nr:EamA family transporter [Patescibacteria group bacterium]